jgi:hypothetical protein
MKVTAPITVRASSVVLCHRKRVPAQMPLLGAPEPLAVGRGPRNRPRTAAIRVAEMANDTALAANAGPAPTVA